MTGAFRVRYTDAARDDLLRLFDFLLDRAQTAGDFDAAQEVIDMIASEVEGRLSRAPFIYRKAGQGPFSPPADHRDSRRRLRRVV